MNAYYKTKLGIKFVKLSYEIYFFQNMHTILYFKKYCIYKMSSGTMVERTEEVCTVIKIQ